jgi:ketosteroid isomerase-like protein
MGTKAETIEQFWAAFEAGDLDTALSYFADDAVMQQPGMPPVQGRASFRPMLDGWRRAFPDLRHERLGVVESGNTVAVQLRVTGTHSGPMQLPQGEVAATNRPFVWESVDWVTLTDDGAIASWRVYEDTLPFLTGLGVLAAPDSAAVS